MQHSTTTNQGDILNTQNTIENNHKLNSSTKLVEKEQIKGSPFMMVGSKEEGYFIAMGKYKLSEVKKTKRALLTWAEENHWNITATMITTLITIMDNTITTLEEKVEKLTKLKEQ